MQLPDPVVLDSSLVNVTKYGRRPSEALSAKIVKIINQNIEDLQIIVEQDLSRWKHVS
jgi:hypothetical protein